MQERTGDLGRHGGPDPRKAPPFMLSYARPRSGTGADLGPIKKFFDDLGEEIGYIAPGFKQAEAAGFDQEMPLGVEWQRRLAYYLAHCRVLVPLLSPPFFESEWCGKEWWVFSRRRVVTRPPLRDDEQAVVPVIWVPVPSGAMHPLAQRLQYANRYLPASYSRDGMLALSRRDGSDPDYRMTVNHIATRISEVMEHSTVELGRPVNLKTAPNAFAEPKDQPTWKHVRFWHEEDRPESPVQA